MPCFCIGRACFCSPSDGSGSGPVPGWPVHRWTVSRRPVHRRTVSRRPIHRRTVSRRPIHRRTVSRRPVHRRTVSRRPVHRRTVSRRPVHRRAVSRRPVHRRTVSRRPVHRRTVSRRPVHRRAVTGWSEGIIRVQIIGPGSGRPVLNSSPILLNKGSAPLLPGPFLESEGVPALRGLTLSFHSCP
ncbi:MAG: histone H1-like repetitive region-containing protein [Bacillota bacterium]